MHTAKNDRICVGLRRRLGELERVRHDIRYFLYLGPLIMMGKQYRVALFAKLPYPFLLAPYFLGIVRNHFHARDDVTAFKATLAALPRSDIFISDNFERDYEILWHQIERADRMRQRAHGNCVHSSLRIAFKSAFRNSPARFNKHVIQQAARPESVQQFRQFHPAPDCRAVDQAGISLSGFGLQAVKHIRRGQSGGLASHFHFNKCRLLAKTPGSGNGNRSRFFSHQPRSAPNDCS